MIEIELGDLKKVGNDIAELLGERMGTEVAVSNCALIVPDTVNGKRLEVKDVKFQVKHVLHHLDLSDDYRVLAGHRTIIIEKVKKMPHHAQREGTPPSPYQTLPYFFPG
ncbi:MAG: hypothetical protein ACLPY5_05965 [Candidatus Bathyarchaeia archaeon]